MKIRIAASIVLAAGLALGASGCSLIAHNGTTKQYAPSDGVEVSTADVVLRNILLVADESGENFNVVFTAVNRSEAPARVSMTFELDGKSALVDFVAPVGLTTFGNSEEGQDVLVASLPNLAAGQTVETFFAINGQGDLHEFVPVLDGTLLEYEAYVLDDQAVAASTGDEANDASSTDATSTDNADKPAE